VAARLALFAALVPLVAACGNTPAPKTYYGIYVKNLPKHRLYRLNWVERTPLNLVTFRVTSLDVGPTGWKATVSFTNTSRYALKLPTGGAQSPKSFGLGVFTDALSPRVEDAGNYLIKAEISPPLPTILRPGRSWTSTFSSPDPPRAQRVLRLVFGTFFFHGKPPPGAPPFFAWVTSQYVVSPPPQGVLATTTTGP
jgi:hypothetical protein